jgi:hypothetical protein
MIKRQNSKDKYFAKKSKSQPKLQPQHVDLQINVNGGQIHNLQINSGNGTAHIDARTAPTDASNASDAAKEAYIQQKASDEQKALFPSLDSYFAVKHDSLHFIYRVLELPQIENVQKLVSDYLRLGTLTMDDAKRRKFAYLVMKIAGNPGQGEMLYRHILDLYNNMIWDGEQPKRVKKG